MSSVCLEIGVLVVMSTFHSLMVIISLSSSQHLKMKIFFYVILEFFFTSFLILLGIAGKYTFIIAPFCLRVNETMTLYIGVIPK